MLGVISDSKGGITLALQLELDLEFVGDPRLMVVVRARQAGGFSA